MIKHPNQRVGVFIDVQNMYYTAKKLWNCKVDFGQIVETAVADRQLIRAIAYVVEATGEEAPFFEALHQRGLETKTREVTVFASGAKKADWDVGMAVDAIRIGEILDVIVLVTGDGDFVELVEYLRHHGRQVEVIAFKETSSSKLIEAADDYINMSDDLDRYLINYRARGKSARGSKSSGDPAKSETETKSPAKIPAPAKKAPAKKRPAATAAEKAEPPIPPPIRNVKRSAKPAAETAPAKKNSGSGRSRSSRRRANQKKAKKS